MAKPEASETTIQKQIVDMLNLHHRVKVWRQNSGTMGGRKYRTGIEGCADITGAIAPWGTRLEIEVKKPGEKQSSAQVKFEAEAGRFGVVYFVARSPEEAFEKVAAAIRELQAKSTGKKSWGIWAA